MNFTRVLPLALLIALAALSVSAQTAQVSTSKLTGAEFQSPQARAE